MKTAEGPFPDTSGGSELSTLLNLGIGRSGADRRLRPGPG